MTITSRRDRRSRRKPGFSPEYLEDRVVPSTIGAEWHGSPSAAMIQDQSRENALVAPARGVATVAPTDAGSDARSDVLKPAVGASLRSGSLGLNETELARKAHHRHRHRARMAPKLMSVYAQYQTYVSRGSKGTFSPTGAKEMEIQGTNVGINIQMSDTSNFQGMLAQLQSDGLQVTQDSATNGTVAGMLPIAQLPKVAAISPMMNITLPTNVGTPLESVYAQYQTYVSQGSKGTFSPTGVNGLEIQGTNVGISVHTTDTAGFQGLLTQLQADGLQATSDSATYGLIDGMLPIAQLPTVSKISTTLSITPLYPPTLR